MSQVSFSCTWFCQYSIGFFFTVGTLNFIRVSGLALFVTMISCSLFFLYEIKTFTLYDPSKIAADDTFISLTFILRRK